MYAMLKLVPYTRSGLFGGRLRAVEEGYTTGGGPTVVSTYPRRVAKSSEGRARYV